ncbi:hypothetical protein G6F42_016258 [Rhizopus arrhizus]|nr:hypothetical protein G6F42_016258 [Rhizopus arrhizus]
MGTYVPRNDPHSVQQGTIKYLDGHTIQNDAAFCWFSLTVAATSELYATAATTASETAISSAEGNTGVVAISEAVAAMAATSVAVAVAVAEIGVGVGVEVLDSGDWNA